ncbi:hypothetical protein Hanom_Chr09g00853321 [Helianthus anomalus]
MSDSCKLTRYKSAFGILVWSFSRLHPNCNGFFLIPLTCILLRFCMHRKDAEG